MKKFHEILLNVWREACRQIEIGESTAAIAALLKSRMPLQQVVVRRIERENSCLETVALGLPGPEATEPAITELEAPEMDRLLAWCRRETVAQQLGMQRLEGPLKKIFPGPFPADALAGPLIKEGKLLGILELLSRPDAVFEARHLEMMRILLEPFAVALENDTRLREMITLREAAEADKRSLLTKLSRKNLSDTIVGMDSGLRSVMERVALVARSNVPVMIFGETGTGKELISREIHRRSPRASGPFIRVNCGAIPPELIDSQLFGHERGAFTGAVDTHKGWFERADGGTLFLDEIGELSLAAQVRLLRILQDGWLERVGGRKLIHIDVRVVVATHRDLAGMVTDGKFREDLWYRLAVFPIILPPLRDRTEDIPSMARHFAERAAIRFGLSTCYPAAEEVKLLREYPWPGNVRELASVINRAAILGDGKRLEIARALGWMNPGGLSGKNPAYVPGAGGGSEFPSLDDAVRQHIVSALQKCGGQIEGTMGAAALLDVNPHTLRARMRKLGIRWQQYRK